MRSLLHTWLVDTTRKRKNGGRKPAAALHNNWSWLWSETSCEFLLWFCTTCFSENCPFPIGEVVHIMELVITMDNGNEKLFTFSSLKSRRLANYMCTRVAWFPDFFGIGLQSVLVIPMGTQSYQVKFERARSHARLPLERDIFTTIAM